MSKCTSPGGAQLSLAPTTLQVFTDKGSGRERGWRVPGRCDRLVSPGRPHASQHTEEASVCAGGESLTEASMCGWGCSVLRKPPACTPPSPPDPRSSCQVPPQDHLSFFRKNIFISNFLDRTPHLGNKTVSLSTLSPVFTVRGFLRHAAARISPPTENLWGGVWTWMSFKLRCQPTSRLVPHQHSLMQPASGSIPEGLRMCSRALG